MIIIIINILYKHDLLYSCVTALMKLTGHCVLLLAAPIPSEPDIINCKHCQ